MAAAVALGGCTLRTGMGSGGGNGTAGVGADGPCAGWLSQDPGPSLGLPAPKSHGDRLLAHHRGGS
eukprot:5955892-Alexandrium_andersonii.AAC.1